MTILLKNDQDDLFLRPFRGRLLGLQIQVSYPPYSFDAQLSSLYVTISLTPSQITSRNFLPFLTKHPPALSRTKSQMSESYNSDSFSFSLCWKIHKGMIGSTSRSKLFFNQELICTQSHGQNL